LIFPRRPRTQATERGQKRGLAVGPTNATRERKSALSPITAFQSPLVSKGFRPHQSQLVEGHLGHSFLDTLPALLIGDKAYDSDR
jgi:hypothetical protein